MPSLFPMNTVEGLRFLFGETILAGAKNATRPEKAVLV